MEYDKMNLNLMSDNEILEYSHNVNLDTFETFVNSIDTDSILESIDAMTENVIVTNDKKDYSYKTYGKRCPIYSAKFNLHIMLGDTKQVAHEMAIQLSQASFKKINIISRW